MDYFGWLWVVALCWCVCYERYGEESLNNLERVSPIMLEMGLWEIFVCVWAVLAVFSILEISMERLKNTGKGKATSSSMERAVKKKKGRYVANREKG